MREVYEALRRHAASDGKRLIFSDSAKRLSRHELLACVGALLQKLGPDVNRIGILAPNGVDWAVAQFAGVAGGKTIVPLPPFFNPDQLGHIIRDAGVELILCSDELRSAASGCGVATQSIGRDPFVEPFEFVEGFRQIIYTSGSTGRPKGVRLDARQLGWSAQAVAEATQARETDSFLSILPLPLLLESISAIFIPLLVGGRAHFVSESARVFAGAGQLDLASLFEDARPTCTVFAPQLLGLWVQQLRMAGWRAPEGLRFVAVGGAPTPPALIEAAWAVGIPVYEGYGLSECCSVVTLNRPGALKKGSVGRPLPGLEVSIEEGEIVVEGPSVMEGYLGGPNPGGTWRTGDLGSFDAEGFLTVFGRKDNLIVTSLGRNVSPEWIETMLLTDRRIGLCMVFGHGEPRLSALIVPSAAGAEWFAEAGRDEALELISRACASAPSYAVPQEVIVMPLQEAVSLGLMTSNGRFRRKEAAALLKSRCGAAGLTEADADAMAPQTLSPLDPGF